MLVVDEGFDPESVAAGFDSAAADFDSADFDSPDFGSAAELDSPAALSVDEELPDDLGA